MDRQQFQQQQQKQQTDVSLLAARRVHYAEKLPISEKSRQLAQKSWKKMYTLNPAEFTRNVTRQIILFSGTIRAMFLARPLPSSSSTAAAQQV
jgi:hypothetical protein